jgi:hypothetical protein
VPAAEGWGCFVALLLMAACGTYYCSAILPYPLCVFKHTESVHAVLPPALAGTGKSSLVCALCVGLGGSTNVSRAAAG